MRPDCALACREASMKQRSPALETYSRPDRSRMIAPPPCPALSTYVISSRVKSLQVSWSRRPSTRRTTALAKRREETFIVGVIEATGAPIVSQPLLAEETQPLLRRAIREREQDPVRNSRERVFHPSRHHDHVVGRHLVGGALDLDAPAALDAHEHHAVARPVRPRREGSRHEPDRRGDGGHRPAA